MTTPPSVITIELDGTCHQLVEFRRYLEERSTAKWPPVRDGRRGRPKGGGFSALASALSVSASRLSHVLTDAERDGRLTVGYAYRFAIALGHTEIEAFLNDYYGWYRQLTTKENR